MTIDPTAPDRPELCPAGHPLAPIYEALDDISDHVRQLDAPSAIAELRCFGANLVERLSLVLSASDEMALRTFVSIVQRFDAGEEDGSDADDWMPALPEAIHPGTCSCHSEAPIYHKLNAYIDAQRAHAFEHEAPRP